MFSLCSLEKSIFLRKINLYRWLHYKRSHKTNFNWIFLLIQNKYFLTSGTLLRHADKKTDCETAIWLITRTRITTLRSVPFIARSRSVSNGTMPLWNPITPIISTWLTSYQITLKYVFRETMISNFIVILLKKKKTISAALMNYSRQEKLKILTFLIGFSKLRLFSDQGLAR